MHGKSGRIDETKQVGGRKKMGSTEAIGQQELQTTKKNVMTIFKGHPITIVSLPFPNNCIT